MKRWAVWKVERKKRKEERKKRDRRNQNECRAPPFWFYLETNHQNKSNKRSGVYVLKRSSTVIRQHVLFQWLLLRLRRHAKIGHRIQLLLPGLNLGMNSGLKLQLLSWWSDQLTDLINDYSAPRKKKPNLTNHSSPIGRLLTFWCASKKTHPVLPAPNALMQTAATVVFLKQQLNINFLSHIHFKLVNFFCK